MDALIGSTGFVGGHLSAQHDFAAQFNSRNMPDATGRSFSTVVCAAAPGSMFEANRFPDQDRERIGRLMDQLSCITAERFVLISSIAVLLDFTRGDHEKTNAFQIELAYGRHRRDLEVFCVDRFANCLIVRLPALFGQGLKKNFLFDIMNPMPSMLPEARFLELADMLPSDLRDGLQTFYCKDPALGLRVIDRARLDSSGRRAAYDAAVAEVGMSALQFTNPESHFQYYDMSRLWADICLCQGQDMPVIHLAPEPLPAGTVFSALTGLPMPATAACIHREDMRTRHSGLWGRSDGYIEGSAAVLGRLQAFFAVEKGARP